MATVTIPSQQREISNPEEVAAFLAPFGIWYRRSEETAALGDRATDEEILAAHADDIRELSERGGYVTADVINVRPDTPNLEAMLDRFNKEHTHSEDEVRFIVGGRGVFHIHPKAEDGTDGPVFAIEVTSGDLITVPKGTRHWFDLCTERSIRAIRLFQDKSGWTPEYIEDGVHAGYAPMCWNRTELPAGSLGAHAENLKNLIAAS